MLGFDHDDSLWYFDCDFEATNLPAEYLWGPGNREEALAWLATVQVTPDVVDYLDRHFVVHIQGDQVELPRNLNQFAGLSEEAQDGRWMLLKADFPGDALGHGRVIASGAKGHTDSGFCEACAVEVEADGSWSSVLHVAEQLEEIAPQPPRGIRVEQSRFRWL